MDDAGSMVEKYAVDPRFILPEFPIVSRQQYWLGVRGLTEVKKLT